MSKKKCKNNPNKYIDKLNINDVLAYIEYFMNDEKKAVAEYAKFLDWLPEKSDLYNLIYKVMKQEYEHYELMKEIYKKLKNGN